MIITELSLKNCGPFKETGFKFIPGFNLLYGENETGKSTTSHALVDMLFGKPDKGLYSLVHSSDQMEIEAVIEKEGKPHIFVQKSASFAQKSITRGDKKPYNSRAMFHEAFVPEGIDKSFYLSSFRLNANELKRSRELFAKDTGKINAILFDAMGNETFSNLPYKLDTEADKLYSPSRNAKKKLVNKLISDIQELKNEIQAHTLSSEKYANKMKHIESLKTKSEKSKKKISALEEERDKTLAKLQLNADNYFRYIELKEEIERSNNTLPITEQEIEKISEYIEDLKSRKVTIADLKGRISVTSETLKNISIDKEILAEEIEIRKLGESKALYIDNRNTLSQLTGDIEKMDADIQIKIKGLNLLPIYGGISKEEIDLVSNSSDIEVELYKLLKKFDEQLHQNVPIDINEAKGKKLVENVNQFWVDKSAVKEDIKNLREKIEQKQDEIESITIDVDTNKLNEARKQRDSNWRVLIENFPLISDVSDIRIKEFESTQGFLDQTVDSIIKDAEQVGKRGALQDELNTLSTQYHAKTKEYQTLEERIPSMKKEWESYCRDELHTLDLSSKNFTTWNEQRKEVISLLAKKSADENRLSDLEEKIAGYERSVENLNTLFEENGDTASIIETLMDKLNKAVHDNSILQINTDTLERDQSNLKEYEQNQDDQLKKLEAFFPDEFQGLSFEAMQVEIDKTKNLFSRKRDYSELKEDLTIKFGEDISGAFKKYERKQEIEEGYQEIAAKISQERYTMDEVNEEVSLLDGEIKEALSKDKEILDKHQMLESKKLELKLGIDDYLRTKISSRIISKLNSLLSTQAAKDLIVEAEKYFECITGARYRGLKILGDNFYAERKKNTSTAKEGVLNSILDDDEFITVKDTQMSEGTKDQLFLSLRLAFITIFNETSDKKLPFIADDILINFDDNRIENALHLLKEFSKSTQVFFFTHSSKVIEIWDKVKN